MIVKSDSVIPTVAIASGPNLDTKKISAMAKTDSIIISKTMGIANNKMALLNFSVVKSLSLPEMASRMSFQSDFILFLLIDL